MNRRKDALLGASRIVELVNKIGHDHDPSACATCGMVEVYPNSRNVIPGRVFVTVDFRHPDGDKLISMDKALRKGLEEIAARTGVTAEIKMVADFPPQPFEASCVTAVRNAASKLGYTTRDITSGAGHDAVYVARIAPAAMIFTPCIDGISHNEAEDMTPEWAAAGTDVLLHAVLEKAEVVSGKA